ARADEVVVALEDPRLWLEVRRIDRCGGTWPRCLPDLVAGTLVGQEGGGNRSNGLAVVERPQVARVRDDADLGPRELPAVEHLGHGREPIGRDGSDHPLLALRD